MGRRPNQLVFEFFTRGAKLNDSSNRYEHTCKSCGELFRKGRIEVLTKHIQSCPAARYVESPHLLQPVPDLVDATLTGHEDYSDINVPSVHASSEKRSRLPIGSGRNLTGLEALAEASRRLEYPPSHCGQDHLIDPNLKDPGLSTCAAYAGCGAARGNSLLSQVDDSTYGTPRATSAINGTAREPSNLTLIAASASNLEAMMPQSKPDNQMTSETPENPDIGDQSQSSNPLSHAFGDTDFGDRSIDESLPKTTSIPNASPNAQPGASSRRVSDTEQGRSQLRAQKVRGKFSDVRRQEVQNVRKQGACIRCRMLRKTCSGESPCKTCASVTSARIWKLECLRTNIYKELDIYSINYFASTSNQALQNLANYSTTQHRRLLSIAIDENCGTSMMFQATINRHRYMEDQSSNQNPGLTRHDTLFIDQSMAHILTQLQSYLQASATALYSVERCEFLRATLILAFEIASKEEDKLLIQALELWSLTRAVCTASDSWRFAIKEQSGASDHDLSIPDQSLGLTEYNDSLETVFVQIQAAADSRMSTLSKSIMIDLEKRLERKERCQGIECYLVGVIFLNCVERMSWCLKAHENTKETPESPLIQHVDFYLEQCERFSEFLSKLFGMRGILLRVRADPADGIWHTVAPIAPISDEWFCNMRLTNEFVAERQGAHFDVSDFRSMDLKYCSRLLLREDST